MKRTGNLIEPIAEMDNLRLAFWKANRAKEGKLENREFAANLSSNLLQMRNDILCGDVSVGDYHYFKIFDPKERTICAASFRERVLHHAIMNVCHHVFERFQIYDSYATRIGKGQYAALERAKIFQKKYMWFCKLDVRKYFDSVNHDVLIDLLRRKFKDKKLLLLFEKIIHSYYTKKGQGLPIGNLTSQYFANFYLGHADHFIEEELRISAYLRYMDDMVFWGNDKKNLLLKRNLFVEYINKRLKLDVKPDCINRNDKGLPFLGYVLFPRISRLNKRSKARFIRKLKIYELLLAKNIWTQENFALHVLPLISFTEFAESKNFRKKICESKETG